MALRPSTYPLSTRSPTPSLYPTGVAAVERQGVETLLALTVKLSDRAFKPLFLRFVEWARAALPPGDFWGRWCKLHCGVKRPGSAAAYGLGTCCA